ncbi:unnamed protein product, partial [Leptidea sinapis]
MFRPAGLSDEDSDSDDYGYCEKPIKKFNYAAQENIKKKTENRLQDAIINGNLKEVEKIVSLDLNNNINMHLESDWTGLMHACFHAQKKIVDFFLEKGADPNVHADSVTPVMVACSNRCNETDVHDIVSSLIEHDCLLNVGDKYGETALMRAIASGLTSVVELILSTDVNIEMRDRQGWTAVFWAVHHNKPKILELLIGKGARLSEVDMQSRTPLDIAESHEFNDITDILKRYIKKDDSEDTNECDENVITPWQHYYPGITSNERPNYSGEISHLLYGMNCARLQRIFNESTVDLRTFLLLEDDDMINMGVEMPFERQRLRVGLRAFHTRAWKLTSVVGLQMRQCDHFSVGGSLAMLGSHLHQLYVLEATLHYVLRDFCKIQNQIKFEPPDSPVIEKLHSGGAALLQNICRLRKEVKIMTETHDKISKSNPTPADLIQEKSTKEVILAYASDVVKICSLGFLIYYVKNHI